jgi:hypothetical protein
MWRRGCNMDRRSHSREKQMRRYDLVYVQLLFTWSSVGLAYLLGKSFKFLPLQKILSFKVYFLPLWSTFFFKLWSVGLGYWPKIIMHLQPDTQTGDIVFVLQQKEHSKFQRKGDDLFVEHTLSLTEALCGFQFPLTHLDGRQLLVKTTPGEIIKPGLFSFSYLSLIVSQLRISIQSQASEHFHSHTSNSLCWNGACHNKECTAIFPCI